MKKQTNCVRCCFQNKGVVLWISLLTTGCYTLPPAERAVSTYRAAVSAHTQEYVFWGNLQWQHQGPYQEIITLTDLLHTSRITVVLQGHQLSAQGTLGSHTLSFHQELSHFLFTLHMSPTTYPALLNWIHGQPATDWPYHIVQQQQHPCTTFTQLSWHIQAQCTPQHTQRFVLQHATVLITIVPFYEHSSIPLACSC